MKRKFEEAGVDINDSHEVISRMATHVLSSKADNTVTKYSQQTKVFKEFCSSKGFPYNPAQSIHVAMYLSTLIDEGKSDSVITAAFYGIKWFHNINDTTDPTESAIVKSMLECAKRSNSKPIKKDIISSEHLIALCDMFAKSTDTLVMRDLAMIMLCYSGFLRFSEVSELQGCDVNFKTEHCSLFIKKSKTDIYRAGREVVIANGITSACPVTVLKKYMHLIGLTTESDFFLFRPGCRSGNKCFLLNKNKKLSYTRARECIMFRLKFVAPSLNLGTHSLRASGATTAANAEGVTDRCLKRHGRWRSDTAKDRYIDDSLGKKLFITKQLHL